MFKIFHKVKPEEPIEDEFEEKTSKRPNFKDELIEKLGPDSFEVKYLSDYIKTRDEMYNPKGKESNYRDLTTLRSTLERKRLVRVYERILYVNFEYISFQRLSTQREDLARILVESDTDLLDDMKKLEPSDTECRVFFRRIEKESNCIAYQIALYTDYDFYSLNCYLTQRYRLKYTKKEYRQDGLLFAHEGDPCTLIEMGKGSLLVHCNNFAGEIGEIGVRDSKAILPYMYDDLRYIIACEVVRTIYAEGDFGAIVQVDIYDNPLTLIESGKL